MIGLKRLQGRKWAHCLMNTCRLPALDVNDATGGASRARKSAVLILIFSMLKDPKTSATPEFPPPA